MKNLLKIIYSIIAYVCLMLPIQAQNTEIDSLAKQQKLFIAKRDSIATHQEKYPKNLLKIQWIQNRSNTPWVVPNGLRFERIWGKNTTYEVGFSFSNLGGNDIKEYALYAETRYYFRKTRKQYTFKGFFVRGGAVYSHQQVLNFSIASPATTSLGYRNTYAILGGFGYQTMFLKHFSFETCIGTSAGWYETDFMDTKKLDAFRWNELAFKFGYAF